MGRHDVYIQTVERMEPDIAAVDRDAALASIAISLRRIADVLEVDQAEGRAVAPRLALAKEEK